MLILPSRFAVFLSLLCLPLLLSAQPELHHRARLYYQTPGQLTELGELGVPVDHGRHRPGYSLESDFSEAELELVRRAGIRYELLIEDVGQYYRDRNDPDSYRFVAGNNKNESCPVGETPVEVVNPVNYNEGSMGGFLTYDELLDELDEMYAFCQERGLDIMTARADNVDPTDSARLLTFEGRYQQWVRISDNDATTVAEPQILYTALHHAREPASLQQLVFFMWYLLENYETDEEVRAIVDNTELYFIPCVNPDGYVYNATTNPDGGGFWRKNRRDEHGVDNNRNYDYVTPAGESVWGGAGTSFDPASDVYCGTAPFSEPENRAIRYFAENHRFTMALNNHTSGELLLYPFGYDYDIRSEDDALFRLISGAMVEFNGYDNILSSELYAAAGDSDDFLYGTLGIFAMTPEIGPQFWPARAEIGGIVREMLPANLRAARSVGSFGLLRDDSPATIAATSFPLDYTLTRVGFQSANYVVSVAAVSDNLLSVGTPAQHGGLAQGQAVTGQLLLTLDPATTVGEEVVFDLILDDGTVTDRRRITKTFGEYAAVVTDEFNDAGRWTSTDWGITDQVFHPASPSTSITDSPEGFYQNNANSALTLDTVLDLTPDDLVDARLNFQARWSIERDYDYVQLEVSVDGGSSWVAQCGRHTRPGVGTHRAGAGQPLYDGSRPDWVAEEISLSDYLGEEVMIRFRLVSDVGLRREGFFLDRFQLTTLSNAPTTATGNPDLAGALSVFPTPATDRLQLQTALTNYGVRLLTLTGRPVLDPGVVSGNRSLDVSRLPAGIYLLDLRWRGERLLRRVVIR